MTIRTEQVAATLRDAIQHVFARGLKDPRISGLLTVTKVVVSEDLRSATVHVSILPEDRESLTMHGLAAATGHIRHQVSELVALSRVPEFLFKLDRTSKRQAEVFEALTKASEERAGDDQAHGRWPARQSGPTTPNDAGASDKAR